MQRFGPGRNGFRISVGVVERLGVWCSAATAVSALQSRRSNQGFPGVQNYTTLAAKARDFFFLAYLAPERLSQRPSLFWRRPTAIGTTGSTPVTRSVQRRFARLLSLRVFKASLSCKIILRWPQRLPFLFLVHLAPERGTQQTKYSLETATASRTTTRCRARDNSPLHQQQ